MTSRAWASPGPSGCALSKCFDPLAGATRHTPMSQPLSTTAPSLWLARVASLPRVASGARCLPALSIYLSALHTTAALTGWLFDQLCSTVCVAHCPPPSQASHASPPSRPRARQLGVGRDHLLIRLYDLCRHLQRHPTVRSVTPPTVYHAPSDEGGRYLLAGVGSERRREGTEGGPRVGWWRRVVASRRGEAHRASAARRGSDAPRVHGHPS